MLGCDQIMVDDRSKQVDYTAEAQDPSSWYLTAKSLIDAARVLHKQIEKDIPVEGVENEGYYFSNSGIDPLSVLHAIIADDTLPFSREMSKLLDNVPKSSTGEYRTEHQFYGVYMLLTGLAIENVLKCICVVRCPELVANGVDQKMRTHDLCNLATDNNKLSLALSDEEERVLKKLTDFIIRGRYAVPLKPAQHEAFVTGDSYPYNPENIARFDEDDRLIKQLWFRLVAELDRSIVEKIQLKDSQ